MFQGVLQGVPVIRVSMNRISPDNPVPFRGTDREDLTAKRIAEKVIAIFCIPVFFEGAKRQSSGVIPSCYQIERFPSRILQALMGTGHIPDMREVHKDDNQPITPPVKMGINLFFCF